MARVVVLTADLLFGSRVQEGLRAAGHEVAMVGASERLQEHLDGCEVVVVDLTDERLGGVELVAAMSNAGEPVSSPEMADSVRPKTLGFYSHVDVETRERAQRAGFDLVVPRSRMAREGGELVSRLAGS